MRAKPDLFDLQALEADLAGTVFAGKLHFSAVTDSTNLDALAAVQAGAPHGSVFFADEQFAGRGRADHAWHSAAGEGLYVSIVLRPLLPMARLPLLPLAVGLAAAAAIDTASGLRTDLRWPNDLLVGPRKVGGILVEAKAGIGTSGSGGNAAVAGIGINVHQREFVPALATPATSLDLETGRYIPRQRLLHLLLKSVQAEMLALQDAAAEIPRRVAAVSTWIEGRAVEVHGPQACRGVTEGLDANGFLRVRTAAGVTVVQTGGIRAAAS